MGLHLARGQNYLCIPNMEKMAAAMWKNMTFTEGKRERVRDWKIINVGKSERVPGRYLARLLAVGLISNIG